jgi:hypothetical protein
MPTHDRTRVEAGIFHAFHHRWISALSDVLNAGLLPTDYYALPEPQAAGFGPDVLTLPDQNPNADETAGGVVEHRIHLLLIDPFPPGRRDPNGIHAAIWEMVEDQPFRPPADKPLTLVAYECDLATRAYIEPIAVGDLLPDMPLFLQPKGCVTTPLETTYQTAFAVLPRRWQRVVEGPALPRWAGERRGFKHGQGSVGGRVCEWEGLRVPGARFTAERGLRTPAMRFKPGRSESVPALGRSRRRGSPGESDCDVA